MENRDKNLSVVRNISLDRKKDIAILHCSWYVLSFLSNCLSHFLNVHIQPKACEDKVDVYSYQREIVPRSLYEHEVDKVQEDEDIQ